MQEQEDLETLEEQTRIQLLTRGNYTCRIKQPLVQVTEAQYENKIQLKNEITENAEKISAILRTIPQYSVYFQPILESESIELGKITDTDIEECEKLSKDTNENDQLIQKQAQVKMSQFVSLKTRYHRETWQDQMLYIKEKYPKKTLAVFIDAVQHMLQIIKYLKQKNIVHFNINEKTVLASEVRLLPILANYNLSFQQDDLKKEEMETFFPNYEEYAPWPIEVYLASRIANIKEKMQTTEEWTSQRLVEREELEKWIESYVQSSIFMKIASDERRELMMIHLIEYFKPIIHKPIKNLYENILQSVNTWDTYSMCILWLDTCILLGLNEKIEKYNFIREFIHLIKRVVYANPNEREPVEYLESEIYKIFMNVPKKMYDKLIAEMAIP